MKKIQQWPTRTFLWHFCWTYRVLRNGVYREQCKKSNFHYVWIKDLSRLVCSQVSLINKKLYLFDRCLQFFVTNLMFRNHLIEHERGCNRLNKWKIVLPNEKDKILGFRNFRYKEKVPFVIYGDSESILTPTSDETSKAYNLHEASSIVMYVKCNLDDTQSHYLQYIKLSETDQEPVHWFVGRVLELSRKFKPLHDNEVKMNKFTLLEETEFRNAKVCHICEKEFAQELKHRDHYFSWPVSIFYRTIFYMTLELNFIWNYSYSGRDHVGCNINYKETRIMPVIFYNLRGYDLHLLIKQIACSFPGEVIPTTKEKYISFSKNVKGNNIKFRFIDSFRFIGFSLDKLASRATNFR